MSGLPAVVVSYLLRGGVSSRLEVRNIGAQRQINAQFVLVASRLVVLCDPFTNLPGRNPDDWVGTRVVVAGSAEDLGSEITLLQNLGILLYRSLNNEPEERGITFAMPEVITANDLFQLFQQFPAAQLTVLRRFRFIHDECGHLCFNPSSRQRQSPHTRTRRVAISPLSRSSRRNNVGLRYYTSRYKLFTKR